MTTMYDSRDRNCKHPFGAVRAGDTVRFAIHLPKTLKARQPVLRYFPIQNWNDVREIPLALESSDYLSNTFQCAFTPDTPCVLLYYFAFLLENDSTELKRGPDGSGVLDSHGRCWQLTVYDDAMQSPSFLREGVLYQIFPDRFCRSGEPKSGVPQDRQLREDWSGIPQWRPDEKGEVTNSDYFQGDLKGIGQKLEYLHSLGVTALYLNPIFEAHSNHRYNTADYANVDPLLGTNEDFRDLCRAAGKYGISIILDGVFSHTGSDSIYFNKKRRYGDGGAYNDPESPYREWYSFIRYPDKYDSWWGFKTLPNVNELTPSYLEFICGEKGILRQWMELGTAGFRLDVADELPDGFLDALHDCVKGYDSDRAIIGEVWEDASTKESYGVHRRYLLGRQLDSVMNYPFKDALLHYIRYGDAENFYNTLMQILENYPAPSIQALMNSLSTHDTVRAITALGGPPLDQHDRPWQEAHHHLSEDEYRQGCRLFGLASILQYGLPGIPCVYYGDEAGLAGYRDPFNRTCYPWGNGNQTLLHLIQTLGAVRTDYPIFAEADFIPLTFTAELCSFLRKGEGHCIVFAANRSDRAQTLTLPACFVDSKIAAMSGEYYGGTLEAYSGVVLVHRQSNE